MKEEKYKLLAMRFSIEKEADMLSCIESHKNKSQFIKDCIQYYIDDVILNDPFGKEVRN